MYDVDALCEASEFNISTSDTYTCLSARCSERPCGTCQTCNLDRTLVYTKEWFIRAGDLSKQHFLKGLIRRVGSKDLLQQVGRLLEPVFGKDFTHARSSANPSLPEDLPTNGSDRSLDKAALHQYMVQTWGWFAKSTYWTKANFVLGVLQLCDAKLLFLLANLVRALIPSQQAHECPLRKDPRIDAIATMDNLNYRFRIDEHPELQKLIDIWPEFTVVTPDIMPSSLIAETPPVARKRRVKSGSRKKKKLQNVREDDLSKIEPPVPITVTNSFQATSGVSNYKDFLRCLPIHLAKYILGFLDDASLQSCLFVSQHWQYLAKEVTRDMLALQCIFDEVLKLQEIVPQNLNVEYARICQIPVPRVDDHGLTLPTKTLDKKVGLGAAYTDIHTELIQMEERNIYCGAYNIKIIKQLVDPSRVIHYCGGQLIASGSSDRKIRFLDVGHSTDTKRVIQGHAGSIKALVLSEDQNFVISGSFDLSIRRWNLTTGYCMTIYRGHVGVITSLVMYKDKLASGAMDCLTKVWDVENGKCITTLKHEKPIRSVGMSEKTVICGCDDGNVHVWTLEPTSLVKVLSGHQGPVRCLSFDQWHLVSGSEDANVKAWSMIGKFSICLKTFKHPRAVLCVHLLYLRLLSGCSDGKIRIFDLCRGTCLKVMRASGRGEPVLSFYFSEKSMIINTVGSVVAFHYEDVTWDYTAASAVIEGPVEEDLFKMAPLRKQPYSYVRAQRMRRIGSTNEKIYHREDITSGLSHHAPIMSARCMLQAQRIQSDSMKVPNLREFHFHSPGASLIGQRPSPTGWVSSTLEMPSQGRLSDYTVFSLDRRTDPLSKASRLLSASEQETLKRIKKHGLSRPKTSEQIRLTVNAIHNRYGFEETKINTLYNISLEDDWGHPRCPLKDMERRFIAKKHAPQPDIIQDEVKECIDVQTFLPAFDLKNQTPNQKRIFHTRNTNCFAKRPTIKRSKSTLGFVDPVPFISQKNRPRTALDDIPKRGEVAIDSKERNQSLTLVPITTITKAAAKLRFQQSAIINPFRENSGFRLCTPKQRKEYEEKIIAEHTINQQRLEQGRVFSKVWLKRNST
ncbi:F-box and WD repeat domain containing protein 10B isoform X2 [Leucoraja erinacea]|uniref:F-box and WD repeat domain containing protein 10B isoform X2 n=1 Tax=Leucoraja erinaceus TaxID=7782 RepID=UPI0024543FBD|nr:F-box and WD repeat domain containing protein 10B isoform X2 [Leucoraja erinacea]